MSINKFLRNSISLVVVIAILLSVVSPVLAEVATLSSGSIGYLAMGDDMSTGIGLANPDEDTYVINVAKKLYGSDWENSYKIRAGAKYRVEELRYLIDNDYSGDGYTEALKWKGNMWSDFERDKRYGTVRNEVASADYITISAGVNNFSTYIVEQVLHYVENAGAVKYSYDIASVLDEYCYDGITGGDVYAELENIKGIVKNELIAAAGDTMDEAVELVDFVAEVATYTVLSYIVSFDELIKEIYAINPDAKIYVVGIYYAMEGETISVTVEGKTKTVDIGQFFGALAELANTYAQILSPRTNGYTYVHPGNPELLIDVMSNDSLAIENRIPTDLKKRLANSYEDTAISMIQEMFQQYGINKTYDEALDIVDEIIAANTAEERLEVIKSQINDLAVDEVLDRFAAELESYTNTYGDIEVNEEMIQNLLTALDDDTDGKSSEEDAEYFVVDLMTKAMVNQTFAGIEIKTQQDAYDAIALLEQNSGGDPDAMRKAAAKMVIDEIGKDNVLGINEDDVVELLELLDKQTSTKERAQVIDTWLNDKAADYICATIQDYVPNYKLTDAKELLDQMEAYDTDDDSAIAKAHLLTHFTPVLASKMEERYAEGGFTLQTFQSFVDFANAINNAADENAVKALVRNEIREAAAVAIYEYATKTEADDGTGSTIALWGACICNGTHDPASCSGLSLAMVIEMLTTMDSKTTQEEKNAALRQWLITYMNGGNEPTGFYETLFFNPVLAKFQNAYTDYDEAATTAQNMCADYHGSVNKAAEAFGSYAELKEGAADTIIEKYESAYKGAGETAQMYYKDYLRLRNAAVEKVLSGYSEYKAAIDKGLASCDQLNEVFDNVYAQLCEIAEVEIISLNDIVSVAMKVKDDSYINEMVKNLIQGDPMAKEDKTVAYLALRYYLADSMMIMPSAAGHQTIANQIIKAINNEHTYLPDGYYADKIVNKTIDIYHCANAYRDLSSSESGQVSPVINPDLYVALGDNITSGSALGDSSLTYPQLLGDALAMVADEVNNYAINGMRAEELLMLVDSSYNGDKYTADRFDITNIAALREAYREDIKNADLITINVGINNLTTYPITQTLLAYNGEEPYEMDWGYYIGENRAEKINKGKNEALKLTLALVDNAESRIERLDGYSAYERCERALNTLFTAVESILYSYISYIFTLDDAVEQIAELNPDGTIVLVGFYNPLEGTFFQVNRIVTVRGKTVDLSQYKVNTDTLGNMMVNLANRYLANYVGNMADSGTAADDGSRLLNVKINDTELFVTNNSTVSKDLSTLTIWKSFSLRGKTIPVKIPEYFLQVGKTAGEALHPNAAGHQYIANQILDALDFEIYEDGKVTVGTISEVSPVLNLESEVEYAFKFTLDGFDMDDVQEIGLLKFNTRSANLNDSEYGNADEIIAGYDIIDGKYVVYSNGIPAKNLGDDGWYRVYVKMTDGQLIYSGRMKFSAVLYTQAALEDSNTRTELKALCVSLMNYGAAAQKYFAEHKDYAYETSMNSFLDATEYKQYKNLVDDYSDSMITERKDYIKSKHGVFADANSNYTVFNSGYNTKLDLLGAITLYMSVNYNAPAATKSGVIVWSQSTYENADVLTWKNATEILESTPDGCIEALYTGVAAKNMGDTVFCCAYVEVNGSYEYTPVFRTSVDYYAQKIISDPASAEMEALAQYMVVYGDYAYDYFIIKNGGHES